MIIGLISSILVTLYTTSVDSRLLLFTLTFKVLFSSIVNELLVDQVLPPSIEYSTILLGILLVSIVIHLLSKKIRL